MAIGWLSVALGAGVGIYGAVTFQGGSPEVFKNRSRFFWLGSIISLTALADNRTIGVLAGRTFEALPSISFPTALEGSEPLLLTPGAELDMKTLDDATGATHLLIIGSTGTGKSTLALAIANRLGGTVVVIDPHAAPRDWPGVPVIGRERNYAAIATVMIAQLEEMNRRYTLRAKGQPFGDTLNIIVDEFPAIASSEACKTIASKWLQEISCEARKVGMRLVILSQGQSVKALGLEGRSEMRENFTFIRLGNFAKDHAKSLKVEALTNWLTQQQRPALLDDNPLVIPELQPSYEVVPTPVTLVTPKPIEPPSYASFSSSNDAELWEMVRPYISDKSPSWIVKNVLKMGGRRYEAGRQKLKELIDKFSC